MRFLDETGSPFSWCPTRLFLVSPSSLVFLLPRFPWWRVLFFLLFRLGATAPPRSFRAWSMHIPLACCLLSCVTDVDLFYYFPSSFPFRFRFGHRLFHPVFFLWVLCCVLGFGFCCDSFSIGYTVYFEACILIRTHADLTFFCLRYTICFSYCVVYFLFSIRCLLR